MNFDYDLTQVSDDNFLLQTELRVVKTNSHTKVSLNFF